MIISLVVAATENNVIGKDNQLLWHLPNDMAFFKNTTWGMPIIMGRKTFESMGRPLKGRTNIVITRDKHYAIAYKEVPFVTSLDEAIVEAGKTDANECFVIGGGEIFRMALDHATKIYMTRVHAHLDGDTYFPDINIEIWELKHSHHFSQDAKHAFSYTFETWERKLSEN